MVWTGREGNTEVEYFSPRHFDQNGPVSLRIMRLWKEIRGSEAIDPPEYLAEVVGRNFYLNNPIGGEWVSKKIFWLQHTGIGKHTTDIVAREVIEQATGKQLPILIMDEFIGGIKFNLRRSDSLPPLNGIYGTMSLLQEIEHMKQVNRLSEGGVAIGWGSHLALLENNLIRLYAPEIEDFMGKHPGLWQDVYELKSIKDIEKKRGRELDDCWKLLANAIHNDMNSPMPRTTFWPFVEIASPITAVADINVPITWVLQEMEDSRRPDKRPGGEHPFSVEQQVEMRLIAATMVHKFPKQFYVFGGYRKDYQKNGAGDVASEMLAMATSLYQLHQPDLVGDSRVIADYLADIYHR